MPFLLASLVAVLAIGCGATNGGVRFDPAPDKYERAPDGPARPSSQEVAIVSFVGDATSELRLTDAQRTKVDAILSALTDKHGPSLLARKTLSVDLARCVEANQLDEALLSIDAKNLGDTRAAVSADDARALSELHALMDPTQRKAFAAGLIARAEHLKVDDTKTRFATWSYDLQFDAKQRATIEAKLSDDPTGDASARAEESTWDKRLRATAAAFTEPTFVGDAFDDKDVVDTTKARTARLVSFLKVVLPELTKEQRVRAASVIRSDAGLPSHGATEAR
ncbi:hypothetical protein BH09MYX1_BH09MYX1_38610 [soil metagenome]